MQEQIKAKALQIAADIKKHWKVLVLASPLLLAPIFIAIIETLPVPPPAPVSITVTLPPATPYQQKGFETVVVPSQQVVHAETKIVYVQVPAKDGQPAQVQPVVVPVQPEPPKPAPVSQEPSKLPDLGRIFGPVSPPKPAPRQVVVTPVQFGNVSNFQPDYPLDLRAAGIQGMVHVLVSVGPNGRPRSIRPIGPNNARLVTAVQNYGMKHWTFRPATVDGVPSTGNIEVSLNFKLSED